MNLKFTTGRMSLMFFVVAGVSVVLAAASVGLMYFMPEGRFNAEVVLTVLLLSGIVAFIAALVMAVAVLSLLGISNNQRAFGLPEGTVRAIIALSLILIFTMGSLFMYGTLSTGPISELNGLTPERFAELDVSTLASSERIEQADGTVLYNVEVHGEARPVSEDFAKQLLTTLSTLVVAVAGFYFGARSVEAAKAQQTTTNTTPSQPTSSPTQ